MINNLTEIQKIYNFLGVDDTFKPKLMSEKINTNNVKENISKGVIDKLTNYFKPFNKKLWDFLSKKSYW